MSFVFLAVSVLCDQTALLPFAHVFVYHFIFRLKGLSVAGNDAFDVSVIGQHWGGKRLFFLLFFSNKSDLW